MSKEQATSEPQAQYFTMGSNRLAYTDQGEGAPTVVALHGAPGSGRDLRALAAELAPMARIVRPDFAGFGESPAWEGSHTLAARVAQITALLDALELERVALLGYSLGGEAAAAFAVAHPERVSHVALVGSIGPRPHRARPPGPRLRFAKGGHALHKTRSTEIATAMLGWLGAIESTAPTAR